MTKGGDILELIDYEKKRTAPINFEFKTHHAAKGRQLKRVYDMVREFHTR